MSLLRDVTRGRVTKSKLSSWWIPYVSLSVPVNIQNVVDYLYERDPFDIDVPQETPNAAPAFPMMWMEWGGAHGPCAVFVACDEAETDTGFRWRVAATWCARSSDGRAYFGGGCDVDVLPDGEPSFVELSPGNIRCRVDPWTMKVEGPNELAMRTDHSIWLTKIALFAMSMMNCRNVTLDDGAPGPRRINGVGARTGVSWKVLNIEPMRKVLKGEGREDELGRKAALHICRGHFKDYRESGLFGQHKGIYWWDQALRGTNPNAAVLKSYAVTAPWEPQS